MLGARGRSTASSATRTSSAPEGVRSYFNEIFGAFPDFTFAVQSTVTEGDRCAVLWRATGTFAGPGTFQGLNPNGARIDVTGCDVVQVQDGLLHGNLAHIPQLAIARQIGLVPPVGSQAERGLNAVFNAAHEGHACVRGHGRGAGGRRRVGGPRRRAAHDGSTCT